MVLLFYIKSGPVDFLCGLFFVRLDVARRIRPDENIVHHPAKNRMSAMGDTFLWNELHEFFGRRAYIDFSHRVL